MKNRILLLLAVFIGTISFAQPKHIWGEKFLFNEQDEKDPRFILLDNYNSYLMTVTNVDGMLASHKVTIRKFDQKNQLIDTYTQEFKKLDNGTLYNYLGWKEVDNKQVVVFAESYSGKEKKKDIYKYVFDKSVGKFTTSLVVSYPIESAMKSGTTELEVSENGRYIGIINKRDGSKKDAVLDNVIMMDAASLNILWNKDVPLEDKTYDRAFTVTNSGKAIILKAAKGLKLSNYLAIVTQSGQEDKQFEEAVMLHDPKAISIGQADYLVDFDFDAKGLRYGDYDKLMLYDLGLGKTLKNNAIKEFNFLKEINEVRITNLFLQNNEIHIFTEAKIKSGTKQEKLTPFSTYTTEVPIYKYGPSHLFVLSFEGEVKEVKPLGVDNNSLADVYHSYGMLNINGKYYINTGSTSGIYELIMDKSPLKSTVESQNISGDPYKSESPKYVSQTIGYIKDAKKLMQCRIHFDGKMSVVSLLDFPRDK